MRLDFSHLDRMDEQLVKGGPIQVLTYGTTVTPNAALAKVQTLTVTDGVAFTIAAPTNPPKSNQTQSLTLSIKNGSGGAMGAITWNAAFVFTGTAWAEPADTKTRHATFQWHGAKWIATAVATADY